MASTVPRQPTVRRTIFPQWRHDPWVVGLYCDALFRLATTGDGVVTVNFRVDSGASLTIIPLDLATLLDLPVPPPEAEVEQSFTTANGRVSALVRPGRVRAWWTGELAGHPFDWPVLFRVDAARDALPLLGLGGLMATCRWTFDGTPGPDSRFGFLTLEDTR